MTSSTSTAAASISSFRITRTRWRSRARAHGTPLMAKYWMHNGFLQVEGKKMAKSEGNFVTIHELLQDWPGEVLRLNMLRTHYRQPIDWTLKGLEESRKVLDRWHHGGGRRRAGRRSEPAARESAGAASRRSQHAARDRRDPSDGRGGRRRPRGRRARDVPRGAAASRPAADDRDGMAGAGGPPVSQSTRRWSDRLIADRAERARREEFRRGRPHPRRARCAWACVLKDGPEGTTWEVKR